MVEPFADINLNDYDYELPEDRIALFPTGQRDESRILVKNPEGNLSAGVFTDLVRFIPDRSTMIFNDSRVIPARLIFNKPTGSAVELLLLKPVYPADYQASMAARNACIWECMAGNKRRFKTEKLEKVFMQGNREIMLAAENLGGAGASLQVRFTWTAKGLAFQDILSLTGRTPLPPYIKRPDAEGDRERYQTIYSRAVGSVAAPTAGLHFTPGVFTGLVEKEISMEFITLHVGAGTFLPVKSQAVSQHEMHAEYFRVTKSCLRALVSAKGRVIAVGTTAARTLESLYWLGVKTCEKPGNPDSPMFLDQWEPYGMESRLTAGESFSHLLRWMDGNGLTVVSAFTKLMIVPGYRFRVTDVLLTNFHQPKSTLLLLLAAFAGDGWREDYRYALENGFRFLSYGDASLFFRHDPSAT